MDRTALRWWLVAATAALGGHLPHTSTNGHRPGLSRSVELAAIGRRVCETEYDLLNLLEGRRNVTRPALQADRRRAWSPPVAEFLEGEVRDRDHPAR